MAWNRSVEPVKPVKREAPSMVKGLAAGAVVVLAGLAACYFIFSGGGNASKPTVEKGGQIKAVKPAAAQGAADLKKSSVSAVASKATKVLENVTKQAEASVESATTNAADAANGEKKKDSRLFKNAMDQLMAMVAPKNVGDSVPPLPIVDGMKFSEEEEKKILERLTAGDDDSDAILERKELVQSMRDEYQEMKKHGWTFIDYIKALEAKANLDTEVLEESVKLHQTVFEDTTISDEEYTKTLEKINKVLTDRGIKPIQPPAEDEGDETADNQPQTK